MASASKPVRPAAAAEADPFRYGWREVVSRDARGQPVVTQVPLTLEDVLHPQENDRVSASIRHRRTLGLLTNILETRCATQAGLYLASDVLIDWGVKRLGNHCPDVALLGGMRTPPPETAGTVRLAEYGAHPIFVIEIVSPSTRDVDVAHKVREYYRAGVPLYIIVDQEADELPRSLLVYERGKGTFRRRRLRPPGQVLLEPLGIVLSLRADQVICTDAASGQELESYQQVSAARAGVVQQLDFADQRIQEQERTIEQLVLEQRALRNEMSVLREEVQRLKAR